MKSFLQNNIRNLLRTVRRKYRLFRLRPQLLQSVKRAPRDERKQIKAAVDELKPWLHNYEIASGVWTNPTFDGAGYAYPAERWKLVEPFLPEVRQKACLDVGCSAGFFSFKLKELGADYVLGVDGGEQARAIDQAQVAAGYLRARVDFRRLSIYDLSKIGQTFDVVQCLGVLYHLRHPLLAMESLRSVCAPNGTLILQTITTRHNKELRSVEIPESLDLRSPVLDQPSFPSLHFIEGKLDNDSSCWYLPNIEAVLGMCRSSGFEVDEVTFPTNHEIIVRCTPFLVS